jgi:uncharacterized cupredoxin-like copper-binding protein
MRPATRTTALLAAALAAGAGVVLAVVSWAGAGDARAAAPRVVHVAERDFRISAPTRVRAGKIRLVASNKGPDTHELIVVREGPGQLPLRADGVTVDEDALDHAIVASVEGYAPGASRTITLDLRPGRYELFCNMSGHYLGGMRHELVVR